MVSNNNIVIYYYIVLILDKRLDDITTNMNNTVVNVCDWTRARGREKFAFPRLSTATDEKKSHTRRCIIIYELTYSYNNKR